jgi:phosphate transport system permease protein
MCRIILPASTPGLFGVLLLALARSIGETMIVVMAASLTANLTLNPLTPTTTVTAQIVALLTGDQSPDSPKTQAAFALGLLLFGLTLALNMMGTHIVRRYRTRHAPAF